MPDAAPRTDAFWRAAVILTAVLTAARVITLFASPLELYPDEAQYWLWSRTLDWGYFSKPPMVAWAIWASTSLGGDAEAWVRLPAPLFHAGAALAVFALGRRLYDAPTGAAATFLYMLMPGVQLSAMVAATDAPLLFFLALSLLAYAYLWRAPPERRLGFAALFGALTGFAFLSKYAAVYALVGLALHLIAEPSARQVWRGKTIAAALAAFFVVLAPNLAWNAHHHFATLEHTAANAAWGGRQLFNAGELRDFLLSQLGVFGPIPFLVLLCGGTILAWRRRLQPADLALICFAVPPLLIVSVQAFISRANANWSGAGYVAGAALVAAWLVRWRARGLTLTTIGTQALLAIFFLVWVARPDIGEAMGVANSFKRAKGWSQMTQAMLQRADREPPGSLSAIAVNDRFLFNAAAYYGREELARPGAPPLVMWQRAETPQNQAESTNPLTRANGRRVLAVSLERVWIDEMKADFTATDAEEILHVSLDHKRRRTAEMFVGSGFAPRPRDPVTGLPEPIPPEPGPPSPTRP